MKVIAFLMKHAHGCRRYLLQVFGNVLLYVICGLVYPLIISLMIDHVIGNAPMENGMIAVLGQLLGGTAFLKEHMWVGAVTIILVNGLCALAMFRRSYLSGKLGEHLANRLRLAMYDHLQKLPDAYHKSHDSGDLIQRSTSDIEQIRRFLGVQIAEMMNAVFMVLCAAFILGNLHLRLMGVAVSIMPLLMFIGIGAVIDFGPLLANPKMMLFGAAAQFGIFFTLSLARFLGFSLEDAASVAIIGAADGPTAIFVANVLHSQYLGAIMVAAYSYMALVPIVQPPVIKLLTTQKERRIRMPYQKGSVSQLTKILFPIVVTIIAGLVAPASVALVGFLMFGNLLRECGVLNTLSETAQNVLANLITIVLGLTVAGQMTADKFVRPDTLLILALGLVAFVFDTAGGVLFAKLVNLFLPEGKKLNPMIGAAGISAFPMSGRVVNKLGLEEDNQNFLLMYSISVNVSGQIASVIAGGLLLTLLS